MRCTAIYASMRVSLSGQPTYMSNSHFVRQFGIRGESYLERHLGRHPSVLSVSRRDGASKWRAWCALVGGIN